jgi:hypothetical protein
LLRWVEGIRDLIAGLRRSGGGLKHRRWITGGKRSFKSFIEKTSKNRFSCCESSNGVLTIKGEKKEEKEEKKKDYYLSERRYGSFERRMQIPDKVDADKIAATFKKGVLTVTLPKKAEAQKPTKKIEVKAS